MANEFIAHLSPRDFFKESAMGDSSHLSTYGTANAGGSGGSNDLFGLSFPKLATQGYVALVPVSHANTFTTGLTISYYTVDDGSDPADLGKTVRLGITFKRLVDAETGDLDASTGTEQTKDIVLESTSGNITVDTHNVANANLDSLATGEAFLLRIRRISTATQDTCQGRILLLGVSIKNT